MNDYKKCDKCHEWHWTNSECEPEYLVYFEDYMGDEPKKIRASNHEAAALKFAQYYNTQNDYCLMNENIEVKVEKDGVIKFFKVGAEPDVHYSSSEIEGLSSNYC
jgi:hypothetical protein